MDKQGIGSNERQGYFSKMSFFNTIKLIPSKCKLPPVAGGIGARVRDPREQFQIAQVARGISIFRPQPCDWSGHAVQAYLRAKRMQPQRNQL